jgi:pre-rRNA-processing protein TSR3
LKKKDVYPIITLLTSYYNFYIKNKVTSHLPTIILRHRKENKKKCSLKGLELQQDFRFITYPFESLPDLSSYILLTMEAPPLTRSDINKGIFLIDATWNYANKMLMNLSKNKITISKRSIPGDFRTAYPRKQSDCPDPTTGLASIEALYLAYLITQRKDPSFLLDQYYWRDEFLHINKSRLRLQLP